MLLYPSHISLQHIPIHASFLVEFYQYFCLYHLFIDRRQAIDWNARYTSRMAIVMFLETMMQWEIITAACGVNESFMRMPLSANMFPVVIPFKLNIFTWLYRALQLIKCILNQDYLYGQCWKKKTFTEMTPSVMLWIITNMARDD